MSTQDIPDSTYQPWAPIDVNVRCQHKMHRIQLTDRGRLVLCDHDIPVEVILDAAAAARQVGSNVIRCGDVLQAWRNGDRQRLPAALRERYDMAQTVHQRRHSDHVCSACYTLPQRMVSKTRMMAESMIEKAGYRRSADKYVCGEHTTTVNVSDVPSAKGGCKKVWSANNKWSGTRSYLKVYVRRNWFFQVYRKGLALVGGNFVLDVVEEHRNWTLVSAIRQGRGFKVRPALATVREREGKLVLAWRR